MIDQQPQNNKPDIAELLSKMQSVEESVIIETDSGELWSIPTNIIDSILSGEMALQREYITLTAVKKVFGIVIKLPFFPKPLTIIRKKNRNYPFKRLARKFYIVTNKEVYKMATALSSFTELGDSDPVIADDTHGKLAFFLIKKYLKEDFNKMFLNKE